jgi:hypothetical protein
MIDKKYVYVDNNNKTDGVLLSVCQQLLLLLKDILCKTNTNLNESNVELHHGRFYRYDVDEKKEKV